MVVDPRGLILQTEVNSECATPAWARSSVMEEEKACTIPKKCVSKKPSNYKKASVEDAPDEEDLHRHHGTGEALNWNFMTEPHS